MSEFSHDQDPAASIDAEFSALAELANDPQTDAEEAAKAAAVDGAETTYRALFAMAVTPLRDVLVPAWQISDQELNLLADAYAKLAAKYWPDPSNAPEVYALLITAAIIGPRLKLPRKLPDPAKPDETAADD